MKKSFELEVSPANIVKQHFLFPSTMFVSRSSYHIKTVLGSCVALCLFDMEKQFGGMNHYMLPVWNDEGLATPKYGNIANQSLLKKLISMGASKDNLVAKIFGGANQLMKSDTYEVGSRNIHIAKEFLHHEGIKLMKSDTGGSRGRKIIMDSSNNKILLKYL
ncbi:MAG: chemotaxis protein CheD [Bacteroidota bacterium]